MPRTEEPKYLIERLCEDAAIDAKKISPHSLRHGYALRALRQGAKVPALQKLLGHASVATTSLYVDHLDLSELRAAVPILPGEAAAEEPTWAKMRADELK